MGTLTPPTTEATGVRLEGGTRDAPTPQRAPVFCAGENPCLKNPSYKYGLHMEGLVARGEGRTRERVDAGLGGRGIGRTRERVDAGLGGRGRGRTREREDAGTGVTSLMGSKVSLHGVGVGIQGKGSRNGGDQPPTPAPCTPTPWLGPKPRITFPTCHW